MSAACLCPGCREQADCGGTLVLGAEAGDLIVLGGEPGECLVPEAVVTLPPFAGHFGRGVRHRGLAA
jgi:hypothetical protein